MARRRALGRGGAARRHGRHRGSRSPRRRSARRRGHQGDSQPLHPVPLGRYAARGRLGPAPGEPVDQRRQARPRRAGPRAAPGRASGGPGRGRPLVRRAQADAGKGRQRQPRFRGDRGREPQVRAPRHGRQAGAPRPRGGDGRCRSPVRAAGAQRRGSLGSDPRRMGMGGPGLRESSGLALPHGRVGGGRRVYRTGCSR